jgi:hypothetical protein
MEKIVMNPDGTFDQAEITTQGAGEPLRKGSYPASICCNLFSRKLKNVQGNGHSRSQPNITHDEEGQYITAISKGTVIGYKYFKFQDVRKISVTLRRAKGCFTVSTRLGETIAEIPLEYSESWQSYTADIALQDGVSPLYFTYRGKGKAEFREFAVE